MGSECQWCCSIPTVPAIGSTTSTPPSAELLSADQQLPTLPCGTLWLPPTCLIAYPASTAPDGTSLSASGIPAGGALITGGLCVRWKRESDCHTGFSGNNIRCKSFNISSGYLFVVYLCGVELAPLTERFRRPRLVHRFDHLRCQRLAFLSWNQHFQIGGAIMGVDRRQGLLQLRHR